MREYLGLSSCYSCLFFKTHVKKFNYKRQYAWAVQQNCFSTHHRIDQEEYLNKYSKNWFYLWLSGVTDGFGSFTLVQQNNNWILAFKLTQPVYNLRLLYYIKKQLGVGYIIKDNFKGQFIISDRNKLKYIIFPIFDQNSLLTNKKINFLLFKKAYFILENTNLTPDEKDKTLLIIRDIIKRGQTAQGVRLVPSEGWTRAFFDLKYVNNIKSVLTKAWIVGFIETKGKFYLVSKDDDSYKIVNGFSLMQKYDGLVLEVIRSILHIPNKVKYNPDYNLYILNTTNSRGILNIKNYLQGTMKGMKALSLRLWSRALSKKYYEKKHVKIQRVLHKTENKLTYPFTLSKKFSTQTATNSIIKRNSLNMAVKLNPYYITGFADGEGSFIVTLYKRPARDSKIGWGVRAQFQIVLHTRDLPLLKKIPTFFGGIGSISQSKVRNTASFCVASIKEINVVIIPHFDKSKLVTQKQVDF